MVLIGESGIISDTINISTICYRRVRLVNMVLKKTELSVCRYVRRMKFMKMEFVDISAGPVPELIGAST